MNDESQHEVQFCPETWRKLCLAASVPASSPDLSPLAASGTLPALISDALIDEILRFPSPEAIDRIVALFSHPTFKPVALVAASRIYLNVDGCFQFFGQTAASVSLDSHMKLLSAMTTACHSVVSEVRALLDDENDGNSSGEEDNNSTSSATSVDDGTDDDNDDERDEQLIDHLTNAVTHLEVTSELCRAFQEVNSEAQTPHSFGLPHADQQAKGICASVAFDRVMRPFLSMSKTTKRHPHQLSSISGSPHAGGDDGDDGLETPPPTSSFEEAWLLCYLLASRCNMINLLDGYTCELVHRATSLALAQLSLAGTPCQTLTGERVVVSCAVALQRLSRVPILIDTSSSIISEVNGMFEVLQKGKHVLPSYISQGDLVDSIVTTVVSLLLQPFFMDDVIDAPDALLAKRCISFQNIWGQILLQVRRNGFHLGDGVIRAVQQALGRVSLVSKVPSGPLRHSIMVSDTAELLSAAAESGTEEVLRSLLSTLCSRRETSSSSAANDHDARSSGDDSPLHHEDESSPRRHRHHHRHHHHSSSSLSSMPSSSLSSPSSCSSSHEQKCSNNTTGNDPSRNDGGSGGAERFIDPTIESAFTTWHLQRNLVVPFPTPSSLSHGSKSGTKHGSKSSSHHSSSASSLLHHQSSSSLRALEAASDFLGAGDVALSVLRRATADQQDNDAITALVKNLVAKSQSTTLMNVVNGALDAKLPFHDIYQRLANPFLKRDSPETGIATEAQYHAIEILVDHCKDDRAASGDPHIVAKPRTLHSLEELLKPLLLHGNKRPVASDGTPREVDASPPSWKQSHLSLYVWQGLADEDNVKRTGQNACSSSSPLLSVIEYIVSCCGSIRGLNQGHLLEEAQILHQPTQQQQQHQQQQQQQHGKTATATLDDVVRVLHATLIQAITQHDEAAAQSKPQSGEAAAESEQGTKKHAFPIIWKLPTSSSSSVQSGGSEQTFLLKPISLLLIIIQHFDSILKRHVERFFDPSSASSDDKTTTTATATATTPESGKHKKSSASHHHHHHTTNVSQAQQQPQQQKKTAQDAEALIVVLLRLAAKCLEFVGQEQDGPHAASSSSLSQETLCVGVLRRVGALASPSSLPLIKTLFEKFIHFPAVSLQLSFIERRLEVERKFDICREQCSVLAASVLPKDDGSRSSSAATGGSHSQEIQHSKSKNTTVSSSSSSSTSAVAVSVLSPVTSLMFMVMPRVAENEMVPSWMNLLDNLLNSFDQKASKVHTSILSLCDVMVPFADIVRWAPSTFSATARGSTTDDKGDNIRLHCAFALCMAALSKQVSVPSDKLTHTTLAESFLKQLVHGEVLAEVAMPGKGEAVAKSAMHQHQQHQHHMAHPTPSLPRLKAANHALDRVIKYAGRAIHVAFPVEGILSLYRDVIVAQPALTNLVQAAVGRTKRFGTLRTALQKLVEPKTKRKKTKKNKDDHHSGGMNNNNNNNNDEVEDEEAQHSLLQQVRELDFSAIPLDLFNTLRTRLLEKKQFDTLVALYEEVVLAEPEKHTLEMAIEGYCLTHAQRVAYAYKYAKMQARNKQANSDAASASPLKSQTSSNQTPHSSSSSFIAAAQSIDPGFASLQIFSALHRSLHESCGGEMESQRGAFPSAAVIQVKIVSMVIQGSQPSADESPPRQQQQQSAASFQQSQHQFGSLAASASGFAMSSSASSAVFPPLSGGGATAGRSALFPPEIFGDLDSTDWYNIAFRLLTFVTESSSLRKYFVGDPKWKRSLLGIATMRALAVSGASNSSNSGGSSSSSDDLSTVFSPAMFLGEPMLVIENLIMCCRPREACAILKRVPELNCDEMLMDYAIKAVSVHTLSELEVDLFPFGCRVSGVEANEEDFLFPLHTDLTLRLRPDQSSRERERIREAFVFSPNPCVYLHFAITKLCRDDAFRFRRCFDYCIQLYDMVAASCDRPAYQDVLVDLGSRILSAAIDAASRAGVFADDVLLCQEASLLSALFHVAPVMLLSDEEKFYTFDRFQEPETREMAVKDLVFDLLDAGLTSAASHIALSTAGLVKGLDVVWLEEATRLAALGLVDEAAAAIQRLDPSQGARSDTAQILIPLVEHAPAAGLRGCYGAIRRDVVSSSKNPGARQLGAAAASAAAAGIFRRTGATGSGKEQQQLRQQSSAVQQKYVLSRVRTPEMAYRNKTLREAVVSKMVKEFCGIEGTLKLLVRQHRIQETVRTALAMPALSPSAFAENVLFEQSLMNSKDLHDQLRVAMKKADPTLVICRPLIKAVVKKLAAHGGNSTLKFQLDWLVWCHDHATACGIALQLAAQAPDYPAAAKFVDVAEDHATQSKLQPTGSGGTTDKHTSTVNDETGGQKRRNTGNDDVDEVDGASPGAPGGGDDDDDSDAVEVAGDGVHYPPCKINVMDRLALLGRLRLQRNIINLLAKAGPKVQLGWFDLVNEEAIPESARKLVASLYRDQNILDVAIKALLSVSQPIAPILTTALRNVRQQSKQDIAVAYIKIMVASHAVSGTDRDAVLLDCVKLLGPAVVTAESSSSASSSSGGSASSKELIREVDSAVDAISSHNLGTKCIALLACGRLQDAYKCAAVDARSQSLVQEVLRCCQQPPLNKMKQSKAVAENCLQYLSFAKR